MSQLASPSTPIAERSGPARLLAVATSGPWCSVALLHEQGGAVDTDCLAERLGNEQSQHILGMVRQLLEAAGWRLGDLDAVAFDAGPGAFTGLRIGCAVAQGLGFALGCPVLPIGTLEALAWQRARDVREPVLVLVANDARMDELYAGVYRIGPGGGDALPQSATLVEARLVARAGAVTELHAMLAEAWHEARREARHAAGGHVVAGDAAAADPTSGWPLLLAGDAWHRLALWPEWCQSNAQRGQAPGALSGPDGIGLALDDTAVTGQLVPAVAAEGIDRADPERPGLRADALAELAHLRWRAGAGIDAAQVVPFYVRDKVALDVGEQQALRAARSAGTPS